MSRTIVTMRALVPFLLALAACGGDPSHPPVAGASSSWCVVVYAATDAGRNLEAVGDDKCRPYGADGLVCSLPETVSAYEVDGGNVWQLDDECCGVDSGAGECP